VRILCVLRRRKNSRKGCPPRAGASRHDTRIFIKPHNVENRVGKGIFWQFDRVAKRLPGLSDGYMGAHMDRLFGAQVPYAIACPSCGVDCTGAANAYIAQSGELVVEEIVEDFVIENPGALPADAPPPPVLLDWRGEVRFDDCLGLRRLSCSGA
jgi:hypothetical protein